jgi:hypothetical protein
VSLLQKYTEDDRKLLESIIQKSPLWFQIYAGIVTAEYYQTYIPETTNLSEEDNKRTVDYFHSTYIPSIQLWNKAREEQDIPLKEVRINESESMRLLESSIQLIKNHLKTSQESGIDICIAALW